MRRKPSDARHLLVMVKCRLHSTYIGMLPAEEKSKHPSSTRKSCKRQKMRKKHI
jgi:hypothetical protein